MGDASKAVFNRFCTHSSAPRLATNVVLLEALRHFHPGSSVKQISHHTCDLRGYANAGHAEAKLDEDPSAGFIVGQVYVPPKRRLEASKGEFTDDLTFARWDYTFTVDQKPFTFQLYRIAWRESNGSAIDNYYPVYSSKTCSDDDIQQLLLDAGQWTSALHNEIYVFDSGRWKKNAHLFRSIQAASWDDVIADPVIKEDLKADTEEFFDNRAIYEEYGVPWKRGIILHGPPGNGKTLSIKALMASLTRRTEPIPSLYVKSLHSENRSEQSVAQIFTKARAMAPCLLVFEDLDSLVTDKMRSYFLNQVDGLESNDGILMIGSTNHINRLDPAVARRPSRFDRKYLFRQPLLQERIAYARYWGEKISRNKEIQWQDDLAEIIAGFTEGFSFAYLKELFLVTLFMVAKGRLDRARAPSPSDTAGVSGRGANPSEIPRHLEGNILLRAMVHQIDMLRDEMLQAEETDEQIQVKAAVEPVARSAAEIATERFASKKAV